MTAPTQWTNSSLRKWLGTRGFIQSHPTPVWDIKTHANMTIWRRVDGVMLMLYEYELKAPEIWQNSNKIDPVDLPLMNPNIQEGGRDTP